MYWYYKGFNFREKNLKREKVSSTSILKIFKKFNTNKATGIDNLVERFIKDGSKLTHCVKSI